MLAFFETPSSLSISSDIQAPAEYINKYEFPCGVLESIDFFCLTIFLIDCIVKVSILIIYFFIMLPFHFINLINFFGRVF
jgi:hypothetical protein